MTATTATSPPTPTTEGLDDVIQRFSAARQTLATARNPVDEQAIRQQVEEERNEFNAGTGPLRFMRKHRKGVLIGAAVVTGAVMICSPALIGVVAAQASHLVATSVGFIFQGIGTAMQAGAALQIGTAAGGTAGAAAGLVGSVAAWGVGIWGGTEAMKHAWSHLVPTEEEIKERLIKERITKETEQKQKSLELATINYDNGLDNIKNQLLSATQAQLLNLYENTTPEEREYLDFHKVLGQAIEDTADTSIKKQAIQQWYEKMPSAEAALVKINNMKLVDNALEKKKDDVNEFLQGIKTLLADSNTAPNLQNLQTAFRDPKTVTKTIIEEFELTQKQIADLKLEELVKDAVKSTAPENNILASLRNYLATTNSNSP